MSTEKVDAEIDNHEKVSVPLQNDDDDTCGNVEKIRDATVQDVHTSSTQSALDEEANSSNLSDAETVETRDSSNVIVDRDLEIGSKLHEIIGNNSETIQPAGAVDVSSIDALIKPFTEEGIISSGSESTIKSEVVGEDSCLSLATNKVLNPIKQEDTVELLKPKTAIEDSASNISRDEVRHPDEMQQSENSNSKLGNLSELSKHHSSAANESKCGGRSLQHLVSIARQKLSERTNGPAEKTNPEDLCAEEVEERQKDYHQTVCFQDVLTATEPFTTDCLLEMCDGEDEGSERPLDKKQKRSQPETGHIAGSTNMHDELIKNLLLTPARQKPRCSNALSALPSMQTPGSITAKKTQQKSSNDNTDPNKSFLRNTKQNITPDGQGESIQQILSDGEISSGDLKEMKTNELRAIGKALKVTHYYKLKKNDLIQQLINRFSPT